MTMPLWTTASSIILLSMAVILTGGSAVFVKYPPSTVEGTQGDNILLSVTAEGTEEHDTFIVQGPNPTTGTNNLFTIYDREYNDVNQSLQLYEPYKEKFTVSIKWLEGTTFGNLTILGLQPEMVGTYRFNVGFLLGRDINVTMFEINDHDGGVTVIVNATATSLMTTGSPVNTTGSTSSGGLHGGGIAAIVIMVVLAIIIAISAGVYFYKRRNGGPPQVPPRYDPVNDRDRDLHDNGFGPGAQELNDMRHDREGEAEDAPLDNGVIV